MTVSLDRFRIYVTCPRCGFYSRPFLRQVRHQETLICPGCKGNIHLIDHLGDYRKAEQQIRKAFEQLTGNLGSKTITIRL